MDSFEWNKIIGAVLFALLVGFGLSIFSEIIFETETPSTPGYVIAVAEEGAEEAEAGAAPGEPIAVRLASADPGAGEGSARKCAACHTFGAGEPNKVGPNLWDVVMAPVAAHEGYEYSDAMRGFAKEAGTWDFEALDTFLAGPQGVVPGTKMAFAGLGNGEERANVIAYLRTLSEEPEPLPVATVAATEPTAGGAPAESEQPAGEQVAGAPEAQETDEQPEAAEGAEQAETTEQAEAAPVAPQPPEAGQQAEPAPTELSQAEQPEAEEAPPAGATEPTQEGEAAGGFAALVAEADAAKGEVFAKRCALCHTFEEGGPNKVGPNLWGIVNKPAASVPDYEYSEALIAFSEGGAKVWDYDTLDPYLENPRAFVPGTKMIFPGVPSEGDRADVVAYLRTLAGEPAPLPGAD